MAQRYVALDVETPNAANKRISAIGLTVVENNAVTGEFYSLVNPEARFDPFNISLTGISPESVADQPTFGELWPRLASIMADSVLLAHNAPFDLCVLSKCLRAYGICWQPAVDYICTCVMGRACYPDMENHRLNTMCSHLQIDLDHHNAGSDSRACALLLLNYLEQGLPAESYLRRYDLLRHRTLRPAAKGRPGETSCQLPITTSAGCDDADLAGKTICLTGNFYFGSRSAVEAALLDKGGLLARNVTMKTDILIIGSLGSDAWAAGNYGNKVKKALEMQEKGLPIRIIKEQDLITLFRG